jgi:hypothetical protein
VGTVEKDELKKLLEDMKQYRLPNTTKLNLKQKKKLLETANYCFVCRSATIQIFLRELIQLLRRGGVFFDIFDRVPFND